MRKLLLLVMAAALALSAADITGRWAVSVDLSAGSGDADFVFEQQGEKLKGTYTGLLGKREVTGTVKGDEVEFQFTGDANGQSVTAKFVGKVTAPGKMNGKASYGDLAEGTFTARQLK
ncbi:MAG TPA: hypothetical protein DEH78_10935 [Solibacterales bacterium]|nr:hypothetical protein [Bryobacterales bacterium]